MASSVWYWKMLVPCLPLTIYFAIISLSLLLIPMLKWLKVKMTQQTYSYWRAKLCLFNEHPGCSGTCFARICKQNICCILAGILVSIPYSLQDCLPAGCLKSSNSSQWNISGSRGKAIDSKDQKVLGRILRKEPLFYHSLLTTGLSLQS